MNTAVFSGRLRRLTSQQQLSCQAAPSSPYSPFMHLLYPPDPYQKIEFRVQYNKGCTIMV